MAITNTCKKIGLGIALLPLLSEMITANPFRTKGFAVGMGAGVKLLNLKNIITKNTTIRSGDGFANTSSPVISVYARKYMPNLICLPTFFGFEFNYLTDMRKTSLYANLNTTGLSGYRYDEKWDGRFMLGAQVWNGSQLDLWAQAGLQVTYFTYEGRATEVANGATQTFKMENSVALAPAGGLELRYSNPNLVGNGVVTDFIVGWTAGYRNAFTLSGTTTTNNSYNFAMSSNWSHTFGLKVLWRY